MSGTPGAYFEDFRRCAETLAPPLTAYKDNLTNAYTCTVQDRA